MNVYLKAFQESTFISPYSAVLIESSIIVVINSKFTVDYSGTHALWRGHNVNVRTIDRLGETRAETHDCQRQAEAQPTHVSRSYTCTVHSLVYIHRIL